MEFLKKHYRHIFVDFDSTLYLWDNCTDRKSVDSVAWNAMQLSRTGHVYDEKYINRLLVDYLKQSCAEVHLTTWVDLSFEAESKFNFINKYCPGLFTDYIGTSSAENKVKLLEAYVQAGNPKDTILMIDDNFNVVHGCRHAGFDVQEPQFVMGMVYEAKTKELEYKQMIQFDRKFHEKLMRKVFTMESTWNTPDVLPQIDNSMLTSHGYTSFDLILIYKGDGGEHMSIGWYSEDGNWYAKFTKEPVKVVLWTEYPNEFWRKMKGMTEGKI